MKQINIGIIGGGTVGGGVFEIIHKKKTEFLQDGIDIKIKILCVRDKKKSRDFFVPPETIITDKFADIINDEDIVIVVELIGGTTVAKDLVFQALKKGKKVVTANKALIAENLLEILEILRDNKNSALCFEAAVAGGIPILQSINNHFSVDKVNGFAGILNGTTNFILSKMQSDKADFFEVLKEAQAKGFAEADPSADTEGFDARAKLMILSFLIWNKVVSEKEIFTQGISKVQQIDFEYTRLLNSTIKLLAIGKKSSVTNSKESCVGCDDNDMGFSLYVSPVVVSKANAISHISGATNIVEITSDFLQKSFLVGEGAGRGPTAVSVVADIINIIRNNSLATLTQEHLDREVNDDKFQSDFQAKFYVRLFINDSLGIMRRIGEICEKNGVCIDAVMQLPYDNANNLPTVFTTNKTNLSDLKNVVNEISREKFCLDVPFFMPIWCD